MLNSSSKKWININSNDDIGKEDVLNDDLKYDIGKEDDNIKSSHTSNDDVNNQEDISNNYFDVI